MVTFKYNYVRRFTIAIFSKIYPLIVLNSIFMQLNYSYYKKLLHYMIVSKLEVQLQVKKLIKS